MNNWLQQIQSVLTQKSSSGKQNGEGLNSMLSSGALGGLAAMLISSKSARSMLTKYGGKALVVGGGAVAGTVLWNKYKDRIRESHQAEPEFGQQATPVDQRAERLVTALVFAAKSDGHIDARERAGIEQNIQQAGYGKEAEKLIQQAMDRPLDPAWLASGVKNEEEALELYFLSCAAIDPDHFMERSYLNALGDALKIPQDVRDGIEQDIKREKVAGSAAG
ncbi:tellurite resistance TerB family protein [[Erwinia] mediterraneensis]|uniref:tellurite resistance TerB family protein n=1 Tax=[Erwinia] mediterraneensis TaxID=2161819 RepID=UPI00102FE8B9|nr:tellurite resistance TerB family protein [[Erwinia] mediterraneensis]